MGKSPFTIYPKSSPFFPANRLTVALYFLVHADIRIEKQKAFSVLSLKQSWDLHSLGH